MRINSYSMGSAIIEEKLNSENCTLDSLLEEDDIVQEMKNQNQKLINLYFTL